MSDNHSLEGIAIVGLAGRFPQAANVEEFWANLAAGRDCFTEFSVDHIVGEGVPRDVVERPEYVRRASVIAEPDGFDNRFFRYSPKEAELIDPQQRVMLECAVEAFESAGYDPHRFPGLIGLWAGIGVNNYFLKYIVPRGSFEEVVDSQAIISNDKDYMASRIAYKLGLRGPALAVQSACSSSLVAVNMACLSLLTYQCDMALAGGVFLQTPRARGYLYREGDIFSPDGFIRAFDKGANGTVLGEGCGLVVLRRLEDAIAEGDHVLAVIRGSAVNNDGAARAGYMVPGVSGQVELLTMAQTMAGVSPEDISYIETHGTGTSLGDPIEVAALTQVFRRFTDERGFCGIGSVKTNIGHLDVAAGVTGLIKTVCALQHQQIPPTINFTEPNPELRISESPFTIVDKLVDWRPRHGRRIAGVSSFGMGGTNAHVILEEYPPRKKSDPSSRRWHIVPISAAASSALVQMRSNLAKHLERNPDASLPDTAWTLAAGRAQLPFRRCVVADSIEKAAIGLAEQNGLYGIEGEAGHGRRPIIFLFSGQGTQYYQMGIDLYRLEPVFRENMDTCSRFLGPLVGKASLIDILYGNDAELGASVNQTAVSQAALFAIEYAIGRLLESYGVTPSALVGHSIGEVAAACEAGIFSLEDALTLVRERGRLMQSMAPGTMIAIPRSESEVRKILPDGLDLAVVNGPNISVVSGPPQEVESFAKRLDSQDIKFRRLVTSHAYHSRMMDPAAQAFADFVRCVPAHVPRIPLTSNLTGGWMTPEQGADLLYWSKHLRHTVRFADNLKAVAERFGAPLLLEIGPGNTLCSIARQQGESVASLPAVPTLHHPQQHVPDQAFFLRAIGALWCYGSETDLGALYAGEKRLKAQLPTYPFERQRFWLGAGAENKTEDEKPASGPPEKTRKTRLRPDSPEKKPGKQRRANEDDLKKIWSKALGISHIGSNDNFFELGGHSLLAVNIITELEKIFGIRLPLASLIEAPTIKEFLAHLERWKSGAASPYLVPLNAKGSKPPFFLLHSHGGNILEYHPLANLIKDDRPVYAIQCRGLDGSPVEDMDVEDMAATYLKEIRSIQPNGPYYLGGYCFGGYLSLEIAQLLKAEQEDVNLMVLINSATHLFNNYEPGMSRMGRTLCALNDRIALEWDELAGQTARKKIQRVMMRAGRMLDLAQNKIEIILDGLPAGSRFRIRKHSLVYYLERIAEVNDRAWARYRPKPYDGKVVFLRARKQPRGLIRDPLLGWKDFLTGELHVHEVPGFRQNMLDEPNVTEVAKYILERLP